jgi:quercetin dioxygenase-like cupin family protein
MVGIPRGTYHLITGVRVSVLTESAFVSGLHDSRECSITMTASTAPFIALTSDEGPSLSVGGNHIVFKVVSEDSQGDLMIVQYTAPARFPGPTQHIHQHSDETFYVLDGTLKVTVREKSRTIEPGGIAFIPRGVAHSFANPADEPVTMLIVMTPGGFEGYFREMASLAESGHIANPDAVAALQSRYDLVPVPIN